MAEADIRRLICRWVESGELDRETAQKLLERILEILFKSSGRGDSG